MNGKEQVQYLGRFLSGMVMPNIGAFIAWGLLSALFLETGWLPDERLAALSEPMALLLLPVLIAYTGGGMVYGRRGAVIGAVAVMGVVAGAGTPMFLGAMATGPLAAWVLKKVDALCEKAARPGFEMLLNNFSMGITGAALAAAAMFGIRPLADMLSQWVSSGVGFFIERGFLPLASILIEPAKVLFLNNAVNHGILSPLGIQQAEETGKSILFLLEANPGPGLGILLAYCAAGKGNARHSAPGAAVIHFLGGIHEIYFPYILMNPLLILPAIAGGASGIFVFSLTHAGLTAPASPGSIAAVLMMAYRDSYGGVAAGVAVSAAVAFFTAVPLIRLHNAQLKGDGQDSLELAKRKAEIMKRQAQGKMLKIVFACDAGMGSSAMGAGILKKKLKEAGVTGVEISHTPVSSIPRDADIVITQKELGARAARSCPGAERILIRYFLDAPEYDQLAQWLASEQGRGGRAEASREEVGREEDRIGKAGGEEGRRKEDGRETAGGEEPGGSSPAPEKTAGEEEAAGETARSPQAVHPSPMQLLQEKNVLADCRPDSQEHIIRRLGELLAASGYVEPEYIEGMLEREQKASTYVGNGVALPHGTEACRDHIRASGFAVMAFPEGMDWNGHRVYLAVGVAGIGEEHLKILSAIAGKLIEEEAAVQLARQDRTEIWRTLTVEESPSAPDSGDSQGGGL